MKTFKRFSAILLAVLMMVAMMAVPTSAAEQEATITINGSEGTVYSIYKVFDVEFSLNTKNEVIATLYTWSADTDSVKATVGSLATTTDTGYVTVTDPILFANAVLGVDSFAATNTATISATKNSTTVNLTNGYYVMKSSASSIPFAFTVVDGKLAGQDSHFVPGTNTITEKAQLPSVTKSANVQSAAIAHTPIKYTTTITAKDGAQGYILHDNAENGITIDQSTIKVTSNNINFTDSSYKITAPDSEANCGCDFHITFDDDFCATLKTGETITVTYDGKLNQSAEVDGDELVEPSVDGTNTNTSWLAYGEGSSHTTPVSSVSVNTYALTVNKTDGKNPLAGAIFSIYHGYDDTQNQLSDIGYFVRVAHATVPTYIVASSTDEGAVNQIETNANGTFVLRGLCGDHWLYEVQAPAGYHAYADNPRHENISTNVTVNIENKPGTLLPETGGIGTTLFYGIGGALVLGALALLTVRKRSTAK